ncbi:MAG: ABC transporter permease subunit [Anaerolineales bacterium]
MKANIFQHEFQANLRSVITWSLSLAALILVFFSFFTSLASSAAMLNQLMAQFPPELLEAFGMSGLDMSTVLGYFGLLFLFAQIFLAIQAGGYGFGLVSIEESELTADFLITKPVSRAQILNSKLLAAFASMLLTDLVFWVSTLAAIALFGGGREVDLSTLTLLLFSVVIFQWFFLSVGLIISLLVKRVRSVTPYALGLGFGMYVLSAFSGIGDVAALELITPFKHFDARYIVQHGAYDLPLVALNVAVTVVSLVAVYWLYLRRDIPAVV